MVDCKSDMIKKSPNLWEISPSGNMRVPVRIYADDELIEGIRAEDVARQAINVAHLPGIIRASYVMPDAHWGYGFPIGGVAAFDPDSDGIISPGGIGFDINCGVRLVKTDMEAAVVAGRIKQLVDALYSNVPCGVGSEKGIRAVSRKELRKVMVQGGRWAVREGWGIDEDVSRTEAEGAIEGADPAAVSKKAMDRGCQQLGTLGSGNHFLEVDRVTEVYDQGVAEVFGLAEGQVALQIHCGSRGFGHQICSDFLNVMQGASRKYNIELPDRQLAAAPLGSPEGRRYFAAMAAAANYAWCNRQIIQARAMEAFMRVFGMGRADMGWQQVYDVCHNIAKFEKHEVDGREKTLCVHRKGATRAFPPNHEDIPEVYRTVGQPVLIPGDMGTASYVLVGTERSMLESWGSSCHGAGRVMSRKAATKKSKGLNIQNEMGRRGIEFRAKSMKTMTEEMPFAYKDVDRVVSVMQETGIARKVARLEPMGVVKG
jgi:tRNA-splicing ligase RtcB